MVYRHRPSANIESVEQVVDYVGDEFDAIAAEFGETLVLELRPSAAAPVKPRAGMIVYADGTHWNPGAGEGVYTYTIAGAWSKL